MTNENRVKRQAERGDAVIFDRTNKVEFFSKFDEKGSDCDWSLIGIGRGS